MLLWHLKNIEFCQLWPLDWQIVPCFDTVDASVQIEGAAKDVKGDLKGRFKDAKGEAKGALIYPVRYS